MFQPYFNDKPNNIITDNRAVEHLTFREITVSSNDRMDYKDKGISYSNSANTWVNKYGHRLLITSPKPKMYLKMKKILYTHY